MNKCHDVVVHNVKTLASYLGVRLCKTLLMGLKGEANTVSSDEARSRKEEIR